MDPLDGNDVIGSKCNIEVRRQNSFRLSWGA